MIELCYSTFGLTDLDYLKAIDAVDTAGYPGIELAFHRDQFNPFDLTDDYLDSIRKKLETTQVKPACVATASHFFTPSRPHEPSLMSPDLAGRKRRIDLVRRGVNVARKLGVSLVTFGSGFIRDEHVTHPQVDPHALLVDSIHQCLQAIREDEDITLLIEPEPGMYIETVEQGMRLIDEIGSQADAIDAAARMAKLRHYLVVDRTPELPEDFGMFDFRLQGGSTARTLAAVPKGLPPGFYFRYVPLPQ